MKFKPEKKSTTSIYERTSITCVCGKELIVDYGEEGKLEARTWCTHCHRYYERRKKHYIITGYRCFECQSQHKELYTGFDKYSETTNICKNCLEKRIKSITCLLDTMKKEIKILNKKISYNPELIK